MPLVKGFVTVSRLITLVESILRILMPKYNK